jgi:hypothetical protein
MNTFERVMKISAPCVAALLLCLTATLLAAPPRKLALRKPQPSPAPAVGFAPDKGKFRILQQGQEAGTEDFEISQSAGVWVAHGDAQIHVPGAGDTHSTGQLKLTADGTPIRYDWTVQAPKKASGSVDFQSGSAKTSINLEGKDPVHEDFTFTSPKVAVLDNNLYDQWAILAHLYDWNKQGTQTFPVLIPQDMTPGSITVEPQEAEGGLQGLRARTADLEVDLYFDSRYRLMKLEVPDAKVEVVRQ